MSTDILIAGIGNIFLGDDAFGVEVAARLAREPLPRGVSVIDFGIRSYDLAYALTGGYRAVILVDAVQRGEPPGTLYLIELDPGQLGALEGVAVDAHSMNPVAVLQLAKTLGGDLSPIYLAGCDTGAIDANEESIGLSAAVEAAVPRAIEMITSFVDELLAEGKNTHGGAVQNQKGGEDDVGRRNHFGADRAGRAGNGGMEHAGNTALSADSPDVISAEEKSFGMQPKTGCDSKSFCIKTE